MSEHHVPFLNVLEYMCNSTAIAVRLFKNGIVLELQLAKAAALARLKTKELKV